jgi:hypothetical protein
MKARLLTLFRELRSSPLAWILCAAFAVHIVGLTWGLPAADAWEDDGIAPRDFLVGAYETYLPGHYFTYPPVHLLGLSVLTSPVWGLALARAPSLSQSDVVATMIQVPTMTPLTLVARFVSELMALGIIYFIAKLAEEVWGKRASLCVALVIAVNAPLTYYAHTSNLDVPYMFWASFALLETSRVIVRREPRRLRRVFLFAALAVGTKDQAYAIFLAGFPVAMALWLLLDREVKARRAEIAKQLAISLAISGVLFLLVSGAITNPSGFRARIHFLLGPASQNHAYYATSWLGRFEILRDLALGWDRFYPYPFALAALAGLWAHLSGTRRAGEAHRLVAGLVPLLGGLSFILCFNLTARRTEHRFALPEMLLLAVYAGVAFDRLLELCRAGAARAAAVVSVTGLVAWGLFECVAVDANMLLDPRYDAEAFLAAHVHEGDVVETYGANAYLPRFPKEARVTRVDTSDLSTRNPLPDVQELQAPFADIEARKPRFILVSDAWVWRYFAFGAPPGGRVVAPEQAERERDEATRAYFHHLHENALQYHLVHLSTFSSKLWPARPIHQSTAKDIRIFERNM